MKQSQLQLPSCSLPILLHLFWKQRIQLLEKHGKSVKEQSATLWLNVSLDTVTVWLHCAFRRRDHLESLHLAAVQNFSLSASPEDSEPTVDNTLSPNSPMNRDYLKTKALLTANFLFLLLLNSLPKTRLADWWCWLFETIHKNMHLHTSIFFTNFPLLFLFIRNTLLFPNYSICTYIWTFGVTQWRMHFKHMRF